MTKHSQKSPVGSGGGGHRTIRPSVDGINDSYDHRQVVRDALIDAGLRTTNQIPLTPDPPLTNEQRQVLAQQVGRDRPLSEYIAEEREAR